MALEPLEGLRVIDLFSGSGALGIEALSRGAAAVVFVESAAPARRALAANLAALGIDSGVTVYPYRLPQGLKRLGDAIAAADLILLDPPYDSDLAAATLEGLGTAPAHAAGVRVVVEHHSRVALPETAGGLARIRSRRYGETAVTTYGVRTPAGADPADHGGLR